MSKPGDNSKIIELINKKILKDRSKGFLINSLDPFHDTKVAADGLPDGNPDNTIVQNVKRMVTIRKPSTLAPGAKWDVLIFNGPIDDTAAAVETHLLPISRKRRIAGYTGSDLNVPMAGVMIAKNVSGTPCWPSSTTLATTNKITTIPTKTSATPGRLLGMALEVRNTSAEINKAGLITVGRMPSNRTQAQVLFQGTAAMDDKMLMGNVTFTAAPPPSLTVAAEQPNSRSWGAKEGAYVTCLMENIVEKPAMETGRYICMLPDGTLQDAAVTGWMTGSSNYQSNKWYAPGVCTPNTMALSYIYVTGLGEEDELSLAVRTIFEYSPGAGDALLNSARPSPEYDETALTLYKEIAYHLPVGVPVSWNSSGKWWRTVLSTLSDVAKPMIDAAAMANPEFKLLPKINDGLRKLIDKADGQAKQKALRSIKQDIAKVQSIVPKGGNRKGNGNNKTSANSRSFVVKRS